MVRDGWMDGWDAMNGWKNGWMDEGGRTER